MKEKVVTIEEFAKAHIRLLPDTFTFLTTAIQLYTLEDLYSGSIETPLPLLKADFSYVVILTEGHFEQQVGQEIKRIAPNQALLVMSGEPSALLSQSRDVKGYFMLFEDRILHSLANSASFNKLFLTAPILPLDALEMTFVEGATKALLHELRCTATNMEIVLHLFQALLLKLLKSSKAGTSLSRQFEVAVAFRKLLYAEALQYRPVSYFAEQLHISANYLNRCVRCVWNKSALQFLQEIVIVHAQQQLQNPHLAIADVAYKLNFNDPSYFGRLFKKVSGVSPQAYRAQLMHDLSE